MLTCCASRLARGTGARSARPLLAMPRLLATAANTRQPEVKGWVAPSPRDSTLIEELHRLEHEIPWWKSAILRAAGTFSDAQRQAAAGGDMYFLCGKQAALPEFCDPKLGGLDDRYYVRYQLTVLHCWICHVRLRQEPKAAYELLFKEMMEKVWAQTELDLSGKFDMGFLQISKYLKEMQFGWHGTARALDAALESNAQEDEIRAELQSVLQRNMYTDAEGDALPGAEAGAAWLTEYVLTQINKHRNAESADVLNGIVQWGGMPVVEEAKAS
mmetsp:Transcript_9182/g.23476  ORF Transcript_9182/g.23476 Transcript_9182/m.23476 type:complete len:272 (+) Transcript_9182:26-841(+)